MQTDWIHSSPPSNLAAGLRSNLFAIQSIFPYKKQINFRFEKQITHKIYF